MNEDRTFQPSFPELYAALLKWWPVAVDAVDRAAQEAIGAESFEKWQKFNELSRSYSLGGDEWRLVREAVAANEKLRALFDHEIGSYLFSGKKFTLDDVGALFIAEAQHWRLAAKEETSDAWFQDVYARLDAYLASSTLTYDIHVPLIGLQCESPSIQLDKDTSISRMDDQDLSRFRVSMAINTAHMADERIDEDNLPEFYRFGLHVQRELPKESGPKTYDFEKAKAFYDDIDSVTRDAVRSIAAATFSQIIPWPAQVSERGISSYDARGLTLRQPQTILPLVSPGAKLAVLNESHLKTAWAHLRNAHYNDYKTNRSIAVALERLGSLGTNIHRPSEQLVDAVIACEAFYLLGETSLQELRYRISTNAAFFSKRLPIGISPVSAFHLVYEAYDVRSRIVHGGDVRLQDVTYKGAPDNFPDDLEGRLRYFVFYMAELVRQGIEISMARTEPGGKIEINWEDVIYSG